MSASPALPTKSTSDPIMPSTQLANPFEDELFMDNSIVIRDFDKANSLSKRPIPPQYLSELPSVLTASAISQSYLTNRCGSKGYAELFGSIRKDVEENDSRGDRSLAELEELKLAREVYRSQSGSNRIRLVSTADESDASMQLKPEQWNLVEDQHTEEVEDRLGRWPARLLHVPSMTSLAWQTGNFYGSYEEPRYATLSYTWGRWRLPLDHDPPEPTLQLSGISWKVPAVDPTFFTGAQFERVLAAISREVETEFVWVDVACIDQREGSKEGATEIGRQAKIFQNAHQTFIWLVQDPDEPAVPHVRSLLQTLVSAAELATPSYVSLHSSPSNTKGSDSSIATRPGTSGLQESSHPNKSWIMNAAWSIAWLTSFPWFSSLWTLQEAFLQPLAKILDQDGICVVSSDGQAIKLDEILWICKMLHEMCVFRDKFDPGDDVSGGLDLDFVKKGLVNVIERSGIQALADRDRMSLFTCTKTRKATRPLDRIYGIMQIWEFHLGESAPGADETREWTLKALELQLGTRLVDQFPIESQLQVHTRRTSDRQSWRLSEHSVVPPHNLPISESGILGGTVDRKLSQLSYRYANGVMYGYFKGKVRPYDSLQKAWALVGDHKDFRQFQSKLNDNVSVRIALDATILFDNVSLQVPYSLQNVPDGENLALAALIKSATYNLGRNIAVLLLGAVAQLKYVRHETAIGIIVLEAPDPVVGRWWKRLGICLWTVVAADSDSSASLQAAVETLSPSSAGWNVEEGLFG